jgi:hypothetical protein
MQRTYLGRVVLGGVLMLTAGTSALAQGSVKPITLKHPFPVVNAEGMTVQDTVRDHLGSVEQVVSMPVYASVMHAVALRGVTLTDSAAVKKLIAKHVADLRATRPKLKRDTTGQAWDSVSVEQRLKFYRDFFHKYLPELRAVLPASQQATFDRNLKKLEESDYMLVNEQGRRIEDVYVDYRTVSRTVVR